MYHGEQRDGGVGGPGLTVWKEDKHTHSGIMVWSAFIGLRILMQ